MNRMSEPRSYGWSGFSEQQRTEIETCLNCPLPECVEVDTESEHVCPIKARREFEQAQRDARRLDKALAALNGGEHARQL